MHNNKNTQWRLKCTCDRKMVQTTAAWYFFPPELLLLSEENIAYSFRGNSFTLSAVHCHCKDPIPLAYIAVPWQLTGWVQVHVLKRKSQKKDGSVYDCLAQLPQVSDNVSVFTSRAVIQRWVGGSYWILDSAWQH